MAKRWPSLGGSIGFSAKGANLAYYRTLDGFLRDLPQLTGLDMRQWDFSTLSLADVLSSKLTFLRIQTNATLDTWMLPDGHDISRIVERCPEVTDLETPFHRSIGDAAEVSIYRTIGSLPKLRYLLLRLAVSLPPLIDGPDGESETAIEPHFDNFDKAYVLDRGFSRYRNGHIRDLLINTANDKKLGLAIFHTLSSGKGAGSVPLEQVDVRIMMDLYFPVDFRWSIVDIATTIGGTDGITVTRRTNDTRRHELLVDSTSPAPVRTPVDDIPEEFMVNFRRLWPEKAGSAGWWEDWESKPLAGFDEEWPKPEAEWAIMKEGLPSPTLIEIGTEESAKVL